MKPLVWLFLKFLPLWLLAMVIGFTIAWWQRGREARQQFAKLKQRLTEEKEQTAIATNQALESSESYSRLADEIKERKQKQAAITAKATADLSNQLADRDDELASLRTAAEGLEKQLQSLPSESEIEMLRSDNDRKQKQINDLMSELLAAQEKSKTLQAELERIGLQTKEFLSQGDEPKTKAGAKPEPEKTSDSNPIDESNAKAKAKTKSAVPPAFAGEEVSQDKDLGIVFPKRPEQIDDLTEINGVGPVIARKLNDFGIYRFQQIALWDEAVVEEFSSRLKGFRNRVQRDNWLQQATALHKKYHNS